MKRLVSGASGLVALIHNYRNTPEKKNRWHFISESRLKVVSSEKVGGSRVTSVLGTWYGDVVMGVLLSFDEAAILYRDFNSAPSQKQNIIVFAANNSMCCECHVTPTILLYHAVSAEPPTSLC